MSEQFFTSDTHFNHQNIIKYSNRPFSNYEEMNDALIKNINDKVGEKDILFHLGDFTFKSYKDGIKCREQIKCQNIVLIVGNHDKHNLKHPEFKKMFVDIYDMLDVRTKCGTIVLCHYAMRIWDKAHHGRWHLYGHSHGTLPDDKQSKSFDIGVDCHNYKPLSVLEVKNIMDTKTFKQLDHHNSETT